MSMWARCYRNDKLNVYYKSIEMPLSWVLDGYYYNNSFWFGSVQLLNQFFLHLKGKLACGGLPVDN